MKRVHNYGQRKMYELMIPEPAAFLIYQKSLPAPASHNSTLLKPPQKLDINPEALTPSVYETIMRSYGLDPTTADPYPEDEKLVQYAEKGLMPPDNGYINLVTVKIPDGYEAYSVKVILASDTEIGSVAVEIGSLRIVVNPGNHGGTQITDQDLPVTLTGENPLFFNVYPMFGVTQGHSTNWIVQVTINAKPPLQKLTGKTEHGRNTHKQ